MPETTMLGVIASGTGGPEVLELREMARPVPGPGDVLIAVAAAGVNRPDVMQRTGAASPPSGVTPVFGLEVAGKVIAVGEGVETGWIGRDVMALVSGGGYAQYCLARADHCIGVPPTLGPVEAAALPEGLFTIWHNLFERGGLVPDTSVLIHGGGSGIGTLAIPLARAKGARVFTTAGTAQKRDRARALGAELAIDYRSEDFVTAVGEATSGRGVDIVLDIVGGDYVARNIECLAPGGRHVSLSFIAGAVVSLDLFPVMKKGIWLTASTLRPKSDADKAGIARAVSRELMPQIASGDVRPTIHAIFPLADVRTAHRMMDAGENVGKIVLVVNENEEPR